jgi:tetratricopeptide (TPR) repeat protein
MGRSSRARGGRKAPVAAGESHGAGRARQWLASGVAFLLGLTGVALVASGRRTGPAASPAPSSPPLPQARAHVDRARQHLESQRLDEAETELRRAQTLASADAEVAFLLGEVAYRGLRMEAAEGHYRRATELDPRSPAALASLALVLLELGQPTQAADAARRAIALDPADPRLKALLGQSLLRLDQPEQAAELLEQALRSGLRGAERHASLGRARDLLGETDAALRAFDEALRQDPNQPLAHYWRADCLRRSGRLREAERELRAYRECQDRMERLFRAELRLARAPDDVSALIELARLRVERGFVSQAVPLVLRAEQLAGGDPEVRRLREHVERAVATRRDVEP